MRTALIAITLAAAALLMAGDTPVEPGGSATVKIREQHLFPSPVFYAQPIAELSFGEVVQVTGEQGDWFSVETSAGTQGWVHATALTGALLSQGSESTDDSDMIMLAGRGFNDDVEDAYAQGKNLPWDQVDLIEAIQIEPSQIEAFLMEGLLIEGGSL
ncbi:MAG TPA: SH3 domain-containing protein [Candidatus Sabulitectum sp.]|nr:SH3 domain-containing protein [Candidatus Sabulitectum sp.]